MAGPAIPIVFAIILGVIVVAALFVLIFMFLLVPLFKGLGWLIGKTFWLIGASIMHVARFIGGMFKDAFRAVGAIPAAIIFAALAVVNIVIGRWSAAAHFATNMKEEFTTFFACGYRVVLGHPMRLIGLGGMLEGIEKRVPAALAEAPGPDRPSRRTGAFDGYTIVGSLPGGGSGGRLYIAEPSDAKRRQIAKAAGECPDRVVIKSFAVADGSSLPQIVRESRALESAKHIGLVLEHELTDDRFFYVMPYVPGESLGVVARRLHAKVNGDGLSERDLGSVLDYMIDVLGTLDRYHAAGLWHKDIKPENIIIHNDEAHIVDLGLVTPLRSAMTLTTHGTEYFRDPEMVRLALRGVKVHEVNGVKFDIYAAGAVLYYMLENTFPSHGGLSTITKRSPEALKWVVRRAMTDYQQRYESAADMLADLQAIRGSRAMFALRPMDLPSVVNGSPDERVSVAGDGGAGAPSHGPVGAAIGMAGLGASDRGPARPRPRRRPHIEVTNWWTGAHRSERPSISERAEDGDAAINRENIKRAARDIRSGLSRMAHEIQNGIRQIRGEEAAVAAGPFAGSPRPRRQVAPPAGPRRPAREQLTSARRRAQETRKLAHRRRHTMNRAPSERLGLSAIVATGLVACLIAGAMVAARPWERFARSRFDGRWNISPRSILGSSASAAVNDGDDDELAALALDFAGLPDGYMLINEHPAVGEPEVERKIQRTSEALEALGLRRVDDVDLEASLRSIVTTQFAGAVNINDRATLDESEALVGDMLGRGALSEIGCVVWLNWDGSNPNRVHHWVITPDSLNSSLDNRLLSVLVN